MNLVDKQVTHKVFGKGRVVKYNDSYVKIAFSTGSEDFVFPDAFGPYLTLVDKEVARLVDKMVQKKEKERMEKKRVLKELRALRNKRLQGLPEQDRFVKKAAVRKIHPSAQSVFWCDAEEEEGIYSEGRVFTSIIKSGPSKGQPRRLARIKQNTACLLTIRDKREPEKDRRIFGAFMVDEGFSNEASDDGYIPAHPIYRLRLSREESEKMLFWNYYMNKRHPHKITWNTGRHRYFDNIWMAQILRDIISLKNKPQEREHIQHFLSHFCRLNRIAKDELPRPNGALMQI